MTESSPCVGCRSRAHPWSQVWHRGFLSVPAQAMLCAGAGTGAVESWSQMLSYLLMAYSKAAENSFVKAIWK